jgi:hypothetical protein
MAGLYRATTKYASESESLSGVLAGLRKPADAAVFASPIRQLREPVH